MGSVGYFAEDKEQRTTSAFKNIEKKKLLSTVESLGLLRYSYRVFLHVLMKSIVGTLFFTDDVVSFLRLCSKAEKAGFTLSKIEQAGLLSTAENLGLLSLAEDVLVMEPAKITSFSLPFVVLAILSLAVLPHDNLIENILSYTIAAGAAGAGTAVFITGVVVAGLQEE